MAGMAQGAVDSLLGCLTGLLIDEAQLLGGIRGDVEFIKDEMESMSGLLRHLTEAQHRDHQVRAWMKQVVGLARDCEAYVELYVRSIGSATPAAQNKGLLGCLRRVFRLLRAVPARHRVATRIRELKVRARDVGDRRLRYGVTVPSAAGQDDDAILIEDVQTPRAPDGSSEDIRRRALLDGEAPDDDEETHVKREIGRLVEWLLWPEEAPAAAAAGGGGPPLRVLPVLWKLYGSSERPGLAEYIEDEEEWLAKRIAQGAYEHPSVVSSFGCKARVDDVPWKSASDVLREILEQVEAAAAVLPAPGQDQEEAAEQNTETSSGQSKEAAGVKDQDEDEATQLAKKLEGCLRGKRFLILLEGVGNQQQWESIESALLHADGDRPAGSAIIITDHNEDESSSYKVFRPRSLHSFFYNKAEALIAGSPYCRIDNLDDIFEECFPDAFAVKMLLHLLYVNPNRTEDELSNFSASLSECKRLNKSVAKQMLMFCYKELPSKYRSCLLYLSIFPKDHILKKTSLARRWIAEGLIGTKTDRTASAMDRSKHRASATDEAERYFDVLVTRGFLCPGEISAGGNIKSCTVHHQVREFVTRIATDVNFVETELAYHLSIHKRIGLQASHSDLPSEANASAIVDFLPSLAAFSQWKLLKALDLEGCKGLKKHHLKSICKILLLKYLSLRNTDVVQLPKKIEKLQCLETLDIRQTKIQELAKKAIVFPMLKYFLAGQNFSASNNATRSGESFLTVPMASLCIGRMKNMEILSHVRVSNSDNEVAAIAQLLKLRKFGVVLHGKNAKLKDLFRQIEKLHGCLRSLSIRIDQPAVSETHDAGMVDALPFAPKFLQSLNISGVTSGIPHFIEELRQLTKITLSETNLKEDDLRLLGKHGGLRCLRLRHKSYSESDLAFREEEFQSLTFLAVEGSDITKISFANGAAPKLERIVWSFPTMECLSGVNHLPKLKKLELNGPCNPRLVRKLRQAIEWHPNDPNFKHNPHLERQEAGTEVAASTT